MANYSTIESIVSSVENATKLVDSTKYDDNTYTANGVDWFSYGGNVCSNIYCNGNCWIGLGTSSEDLKVNRRDSALWNLWREEGVYQTLLNSFKFLRLRWSGYTYYSSTSASALITFDVLLFDTGDIMLYLADIPTSDYNGTFSLGSASYDAPTTSNRYVTFYLQDDGSYLAKYEPIQLSEKRYLVRNNGTIYTVQNDSLVEVQGELNAQLFLDYGVDTIPNGTLLMTLDNADVLCWSDGDLPKLKATVQGTPQGEHEIVSDDIRIGHQSIFGITSVEATASDGATFLLSFDNGAYMVYDTVSSTWVASDVGISVSDLVAIPTDAWSSVVNSAKIMKLKATLDGVDTVTQIKFNFDNTSPINLESEVAE